MRNTQCLGALCDTTLSSVTKRCDILPCCASDDVWCEASCNNQTFSCECASEKCGAHGMCEWDHVNQSSICDCADGYIGELCDDDSQRWWRHWWDTDPIFETLQKKTPAQFAKDGADVMFDSDGPIAWFHWNDALPILFRWSPNGHCSSVSNCDGVITWLQWYKIWSALFKSDDGIITCLL